MKTRLTGTLFAALLAAIVYATTGSAATINVKDHGAKGDGVTNDDAAIRAAFDAAPDGTGIHFPPGTYFFAGGIIIKDRHGLSITGDPGATLKAAGGTSKLILSFEKCNDITISGLRFDLNGVTRFGPGLAFQDAKRIRIHANHFFDSNYQPKMTADRYAIVFRLSEPGNEDIWITDNLIEHLQTEIDTARRVHIVNNRSIAPELATGFGTFTLKNDSFVEDIEFVGNYVQDPQAYGICVAADGKRDGAAMRRILIANNMVVCKKRAPMLAAICVGSRPEKDADVNSAVWEGITVTNNLVWYGPRIYKRHQESGIRVQVVSKGEKLGKVLISGNTIVDEAGIADWGIETRGLKDAVISNNAIYGGRSGILLGEGFARALVQGNRVSDVAGDAYCLTGSVGENRFLQNFVFGKAGTPYALSGLQPSDTVDQSPSPAAVTPAPRQTPPASKQPPPGEPAPTARAPAATSQPAKSDVTGEMVRIAGAPASTKQSPAPATVAKPYEEPFDSTEAVKAARGYHASDAKIALVEDDKKQGKACIKATLTAGSEGYGTGGVQKTFEPVDFTGKKLTVWVKALSRDPLASVSIAMHDVNNQRAQVWFWYSQSFEDWTQLTFAVGEKGTADRFSDGAAKGADLTKINRIQFSAITKSKNQTCELLWDDFREVK